ncbi:redoxin domain-containing protein [Limisphaera sp. VF-2]|jgi:peroxiredoxin|uniref:redoxin domain-containing protein n=1 Tax=Limisphaera sp. VF-2 TaxID=3400418 RepID=UPI00174FF9A5
MNPNSELTVPPASPPAEHGVGLAVATLVLGILALCTSPILVGGVFGLAGLITGLLQLSRRRSGRGMALSGTVLSGVALLASVVLGIAYFSWFGTFWNRIASQAGPARTVEPDFEAWQGVKAPELTVQTLEGRQIKLSELQGRRVILDFWATWCPPCVREIPHFARLHRETSRDQLVIVGVSDEDEDTLRRFVQKQQVPYTVGRAAEPLAPPYKNVTAIPTTFFIDRKGIIQSVLVGYHSYEDLRKLALAEDWQGEPNPPPNAEEPDR